jgi:muconolactone delta-isomerase
MRFHVDARLAPGCDIAPWLADEQRRIRELHDEGFIELLWRRTDGTGAWLVVSAQNEDAATRQLATLPFVAVGIMTMDLSPVETVDIDGL